MKSKCKQKTQSGFTLIELLVVLSIIGILSTLVVVNFNNQRARRSVVLAQNETVTNARRTQSYALSSRNLPNGDAANYYLMTLWKDYNYYIVDAIDANGEFYSTSDRVNLPTEVVIDSVELIENGVRSQLNCAQVIFAIPFGKMHIYGQGDCDDYIQTVMQDPVLRDTTANLGLEVRVKNVRTNDSRVIKFYGLSGRIEGL